MNQELARRRSVETVHVTGGRPLPRHEIIIRPTRREVLIQLRRLARRREIGSTYALRLLDDGRWALKVVRIREPRRAWAWWRVALLLAGAVAGVWALAWALLALAAALSALVPVLLGTVIVVALIAVLRPRDTISIIQSVVIKR